jgi:DNA primase
VLYPHGSSVNTLFETWKLDKSEPLYVVEGLMDLAALREDDGFKNSTAVFGAAITSRQAYLLKEYDVYYLQDADEAGEHTIRTLKSKLETFHYLSKNKVDYMKDHGFKDMGDVNKSGLSIGELKEKLFFSSFAKFPE